MKHLVILREDPRVSAALPAPVVLEMIESTHGYLDALEKRGKLTEGGLLAVGRGCVLVLDAGSHGELHELCDAVPLRPMCTIEAIPLLGQGEVPALLGRMRKQLVEASATRATMPPPAGPPPASAPAPRAPQAGAPAPRVPPPPARPRRG